MKLDQYDEPALDRLLHNAKAIGVTVERTGVDVCKEMLAEGVEEYLRANDHGRTRNLVAFDVVMPND